MVYIMLGVSRALQKEYFVLSRLWFKVWEEILFARVPDSGFQDW